MPSDILYQQINGDMNGLVMEEKEREEEAERWRQRDSRHDATLPVNGPWKHNKFITTATLESARNVNTNERITFNGLLRNGDHGQREHDSADPEEKPPKLIVSLNQIDKASQIPEPVQPPNDEIEVKKEDEVDGRNNELDNNCCVDCLYITMQCCDCCIM